MTERDLPDKLRYFIARYIVSVEKLEILLLLSNSPENSWNTESIFKIVQSSRISIQRWLKELGAEGFLECSAKGEDYRYAPKSTALKEGMALLKPTYRERPTRVIEAIFSQSTDQLRNFSDAFRFRKDP